MQTKDEAQGKETNMYTKGPLIRNANKHEKWSSCVSQHNILELKLIESMWDDKWFLTSFRYNVRNGLVDEWGRLNGILQYLEWET